MSLHLNSSLDKGKWNRDKKNEYKSLYLRTCLINLNIKRFCSSVSPAALREWAGPRFNGRGLVCVWMCVCHGPASVPLFAPAV